MRILLFDWTPGGHHPRYLGRFCESLKNDSEVVIAAPEQTLQSIETDDFEAVPLGAGRPLVDRTEPLGPQHEVLAETELDLVAETLGRVKADHVVLMYGDPVLRWLVKRTSFGVPQSLCIFFARAHYPSAFGSQLTLAERARAEFQRWLLRRWRARPDAHALLMLDPVAALRAAEGPGAPAHWLPEPPVRGRPSTARDVEREGVVLYGVLAERKGVTLLAEAVAEGRCTGPFTVAGPVEPGFEQELDRSIARMREAGADVTVRRGWVSESEGLQLLSCARCAVLPYPRHFGMSRVLLEAAVAGTPVVAHDFGLVGHLVRKHSIGDVVDCTSAQDLGAGLERALTPEYRQERVPSLRAFASTYSEEAFDTAVRAVLGVEGREAHEPELARVAT